ncbi:hypothetical protein GIB67_008526 [Kingdonia uniflora]|uniref:Uncharacterized protein n=1 Tax=Kingdonia uniflora TaxID=39325 RepID=A0A7J7LFN3_9MAGN|nr:hypothetical protein GIB67_008526 [Kingdonia uniflora]
MTSLDPTRLSETINKILYDEPFSRLNRLTIKVSWVPPTHGWAKINVDASYCKDKYYNHIGFVIRNAHNSFVAARISSCRFTSSEEGEALAVLGGVKWAREQGLTRVNVETDAEKTVMGEDDTQTPFFPTHLPEKRTGDVWSASAHIMTAVIGAGVLVVAWSVAQLGWIGGPISILIFAGISAVSAFLLCDCYKSPNPEYGPITNHTYMDAVRLNLGRKSIWVCGLCQQLGLYFVMIAYTLTASISMSAIPRSNCFHKEGHEASCAYGNTFYMLLFGAFQIFVSQIPDFHNMAWLSILATVMCFFYSFIGLGLGFAKVVGDGQIKGSIGGISQATELKKLWKISQALGDIAFAFPFSIILFEIQLKHGGALSLPKFLINLNRETDSLKDTLKSTPAENRTMKKASIISISIGTFFYICCGCFGYAAFGDETPGNLFAGFGFYEPYWLLDFANTCIVVYLVGGYQDRSISRILFALVDYVYAFIILDYYKSPHPVTGRGSYTYIDAVRIKIKHGCIGCFNILGCKRLVFVCKQCLSQYEKTVMGDDDIQTPFFPTHLQEKRTGDVWTASAHILTFVIGTGVLVVAWCVAELGWIGGPISILMFAGISAVSAFLLCDCYKSPDPEHGPIINSTFMDAVRLNLGRKSLWVSGLCQQAGLFFVSIAFTLTASISMRAITRSNCFHKEGHEASCAYGDKFYILVFGAVQIFVSQIPDFHNMAWLSVLTTVMCFFYSFIGLGLGFAKVVGDGQIKGSLVGISQATELKKVWKISQALGDIAFAFPFSNILLEIQMLLKREEASSLPKFLINLNRETDYLKDTLKSTPAENWTMKKATIISISVATFFYICCGCLGYAAFGDKTPGNLFAGFGFYEPYWLLDFANTCVVVYLVGGYQVASQPVFAFMEGWLAQKFSNNGFMNKFYTIKIPLIPAFSLNLLRLCFRTAFVSSATGIAIAFPYFNEVLGKTVMGEEDNQTPFFPTHMQEKRTGDVWSASAYILTATFGTGVLVIAWSVAELGWIGGPISILMFAGISAVSAFLLCDCYKSPDPEYGPITNHTYMDAVRLNLGRKSIWVCGLCQQVSLYFDTIAFTLTASISMRSPRNMIAVLQFNFVSSEMAGDGQIKGSIGGISQATELKKVWTTSQALGNIAFGFPFSIILFEIQDTLKSTPAENRTMKKASIIAISVTTFFYICCGCFAYAAFGDNIPGNLFAGFGFYEPFWLLDFANACIVIFLVGGYQVISQPVFAFVEG